MSERTPLPAPALDEAVELEDQLPVFDPAKPMIVSAWGRKGAGKSFFNRRLFRSYPFDKLCVDVNGEADPGPDAVKITREEIGGRFPAPPTQVPGAPPPGPRNLHWRADPGSPTYDDDLDRAVGMALFPQGNKTLIWCGEIGEFMPSAQRTRPHMRRLLMQNRHYSASVLFDGPRPAHVNPLVLAQSDIVAVYHLPNPDDRERIANEIGFPPKRFHEECAETWRRGKYWFLMWVTETGALYRVPPLPPVD